VNEFWRLANLLLQYYLTIYSIDMQKKKRLLPKTSKFNWPLGMPWEEVVDEHSQRQLPLLNEWFFIIIINK